MATIVEKDPDQIDAKPEVVDVLILMAKRRKLLFGLPLLIALLTAAVTLALPNEYKASAKLLPPQKAQSTAAALLSQFVGSGVADMKSPNDLYIGMLGSRAIADKLISKYKLMAVYALDSPEKTRRALAENTRISSNAEGLITIDVEDKDKKLAPQLANGYVDELLKLTQVLAVTEAGQRRVFFERELATAKANLEKAEAALKHAIGVRGVVSVDSESRAQVETAAKLRARISAKEIELGAMRAFVTNDNQEYKRAEEELKSYRAELFKLENGRPNSAVQNGADEGGLENMKILRDFKYNQQLFELLAKQYEIARLDEAKDASVIQVLDPAIEPEEKFKPRRAELVVVAGVLAFFLTLSYIFLAELMRVNLLSPGRAAKWAELNSQLRR